MLAPVQVLVVGVADDDGVHAVVDALAGMADAGPVGWLDAFAVTVADDGDLVVAALGPRSGSPSVSLFTEVVEDDATPASTEGTWHVGEILPPGSRAVIVLLEHRWATGLRNSMVEAGAALRFETWLDDEDRARLEVLLAERPD